IPWTPDTARFACAALSPAEVTRVYVDNEEKALEIIVPDDQLSLAIGKKGQNVRLAAKLIGWKIDIKSETRAAEAELEEFDDEAEELVDVVETDNASPDEAAGEREYSRDELYELAKVHKVPGRSSMSKQELLDSLTVAGAFSVKSVDVAEDEIQDGE
ncbi:MAG TPA: hypothetical protein VJ995_04305, partial [Geothermobacteraceae bacterium]|nr:hypothetical protein [Geothermobacteraceae bacterium]